MLITTTYVEVVYVDIRNDTVVIIVVASNTSG